MSGQVKDLTVGNPTKQILVFTLPLLIGNVFQQLYNMADMVIVGRTIGTRALAAIGATGAVAFLVIGVSFGLASGFAVITAQRFGAGDEDGVRRSVATSVILALALSAVITLVTMATAYPLFEILHTPDDIIGDSYRYVIVIYAGTVVTMFFNLFSGILRALGDSVTPLLFLVLACIVNIVLDYAFIVNFHMGVAGAAWATVAAQGLSVLMCFVYSLKRFPILRLRRRDWRFTWDFARRQLATGLAMGAQMAIIAVSVMFLQTAINGLGTDTVKAFSTAMKIDQLAVQPMFSLGVAIATFTAQNYGAGKFDRIREGARKGTAICIGMSMFGGLLMVLSGTWFLGLFGIGDNEPGVVREAQQYLNTVAAFYFLIGILFVFRNVLQGMGKNTMPILASGAEIVIRLFTAQAFADWWGAIGVCVVNPLCWAVSVAILLTGYFLALRNTRFDEAPGYETVVVNYDAQAKFGSLTESVPSASVRIRLEEKGTTASKRSSARFL